MTQKTQIINNPNKAIDIRYTYPVELGDKHSIDIEVYRASLRDIETVIRRANRITNGKEAEIQIEILANKEGSFLVELIISFVIPTLADNALQFIDYLGFSGGNIDGWDIVEKISAVGGVMYVAENLLKLIKKVQNRKIKKEEIIESGVAKITLEDDTSYLVPTEVLKYSNDKIIRDRLENTTKCFKDTDIESIEFSCNSNDSKPESITRADVPYFTYPENVPILTETKNMERHKLEIVIADFGKDSNNWRFIDLDAEKEFDLEIKDADYMRQIKEGRISFNAGKIISADLTIEKYEFRITKKKKYKRYITKVHDDVISIPELREEQYTLDSWKDTAHISNN